MTEKEQKEETRPAPARHRKHRAGAGMTASLLLAIAVLVVSAVVLSGRAVPVPGSARDALVETINNRLPDARVSVDSMSVAVEDGHLPVATLRGVVISGTDGNALAVLNKVDVNFSLGALLQGRFSADRVALEGAQVTLRRRSDGSFAVQNADAPVAAEPISISNVLEAIDAAFDTGPLASIGQVEASGVVISLEDARSGRIWQATNARLVMRERTDGITLALVSDVFNGTDDVAEVQVSFAFDSSTRDTAIGFRLTDMPAADIALQSPALGWLGVLDAPIAGAVRATISGNGRLASLDGTLDVAEGSVRPETDVDPVAFDSARAYFTFDPKKGRLEFDEIGIRSDAFQVVASGHTYLDGGAGEWTETFIGQFTVSEAVVSAGTVFDQPISLDRVRADLRLTLSPFRLEIADSYVEDGEVAARATGQITIEDGNWTIAVDAESDDLGTGQIMTFWPRPLAPKTRGWLSRNVLDGELSNVSFGVRYAQGSKPDLSLGFDYEDARVRYLKEMPLFQDGTGRATLYENGFVIEVDDGWIAAPDGGVISGGGTVFSVPDTRVKPAIGVLSLAAQGALTSVLEVVDRPPLRLMERAGRTTALANAQAFVEAEVSLPLRGELSGKDITYDVSATAKDVTSDVLIPGRSLSASVLAFRATPAGLGIDGRGMLDEIPISTAWRLPFGDEAQEGSRASGSVSLNADTLNAFGVALPERTVRGETRADYVLLMGPDAPPQLTVATELRGLGFSVPALGWSKAPSSSGGFDLDVSLGPVPDVTRLDFSAPGLALSGDVDFNDEGRVTQLRLDRLRVGDWLDASARVQPRAGGASPGLAIDGGRLDLRALPTRTETNSADGPGQPISLDLDTVVVTDAIALSPFRGQVTPSGGGLDGRFEARLAGRTPVTGTLVPAFGRTALRLEADDAGGVLRDAGLTPNGRAGSFYMVVTPVSGAPAGTYDGEFLIENMRLEDAPVLAGLLNAISVVGLLDQLGGNGLVFDVIDGAFRITPDRIVLRRFAAVGPSLGISAEGVYDPSAKQLDMQGVVSPIYFVNGIGAFLTRRGEGLFGFNYSLTGPTSGPKISVNPLSILTPGMFREIFRRPIPTE